MNSSIAIVCKLLAKKILKITRKRLLLQNKLNDSFNLLQAEYS